MKIKYLYNPNDIRVKDFTNYIETNYPNLLTETNPNIYLVGGGDGAMLHAIHDTIHNDIPYFGKGLGTLNFLMNRFDNDILDKMINDEIELDIFKTNAIEAVLDDQKIGEAVNDVILGNGLTDYYTFNISTSNGDFHEFEIKGSGICISTAIGSTAFNFNNNGRILPLDSCLLSITGVVCNRYLNDIIPFEEIHIKSNGANVYLTNTKSEYLNEGSELVLRKGSSVKLAFLDKKEFLDRRIDFAHRFRK